MIADEVIVELYERFGTAYAVAKELGIDHSSVSKRINRMGLRKSKAKSLPKRHIVIPDGQVRADTPMDHWTWVGQYIADMEPDSVINIGDFADMPSLSSYDRGKKSFEGRRYRKDISASCKAMDLLMNPIMQMERVPNLYLTLGNHEHRIDRAIENDAILDGVISTDDLRYEEYGWSVHPFLEPVLVDGVAYAHYFTTGVMGRPASSARALVKAKHQSCVMGHVQKVDMCPEYRADGHRIWGLFAGCCYQHDEGYLGPQGNDYWRGVWVLNEVTEGDFQPMMVSLDYLKRTYGAKKAA